MSEDIGRWNKMQKILQLQIIDSKILLSQCLDFILFDSLIGKTIINNWNAIKSHKTINIFEVDKLFPLIPIN